MDKYFASELLEIGIVSHSKLDFINVNLNKDNEFFIDPCLIEVNRDEFSLQANKIIKSYFDYFYQLYRNNVSNDEKLSFFAHSSELNNTKLGYGNGRNGKCKTAEGMVQTFNCLSDLIEQGICFSHPMDLPIFIDNFAEDCLSDIITNVLFKVLNAFTLKQCKKNNIKTQDITKPFYYWNNELGFWDLYNGKCLMYKNELILLVPKNILRKKFCYNSSQFFSKIILEKIKQDRAEVDAKGKTHYPTKKSLTAELKAPGTSYRQASVDFTIIYPNLVGVFHNSFASTYKDKDLTDNQLDSLLY